MSGNVFEIWQNRITGFSCPTSPVNTTISDQTQEIQPARKAKNLADLFRPPIDLLVKGSFDNVMAVAREKEKWLLVNVQEVDVFDCQKMNRDTWSDEGVKSVVCENFILWQVLRKNKDEINYCDLYTVGATPHVAILNASTGECLESWEGFLTPVVLIKVLDEFLKKQNNDGDVPLIERPGTRVDLSEEAEVEAAIYASLGEPYPPPITTTTSSTPPPQPIEMVKDIKKEHDTEVPPLSDREKRALAAENRLMASKVMVSQPSEKSMKQQPEDDKDLLAKNSALQAEIQALKVEFEGLKGSLHNHQRSYDGMTNTNTCLLRRNIELTNALQQFPRPLQGELDLYVERLSNHLHELQLTPLDLLPIPATHSLPELKDIKRVLKGKLEEVARRTKEVRKEKMREALDASLCAICMERRKDTFLDPCGHALCQICSTLMVKSMQCPMCRKKVDGKKDLFL